MPSINNGRNNYRKYPGVKGIRPDMKEVKRTEAVDRTNAWRELTPQAQLALLDKRLGAGMGAKKQRARLLAIIAKAESQKAVDAELAKRKEKKNESPT